MRLPLFLFLLINVNFIVAQQPDSSTTIPSGDKVDIERIIKKKTSRADIHYQNANYDLALSNLKEVVALIPDSADVHYKIGLCQFQLNKDSLAQNEFEKAYALGKNKLPEIHYYLAITKQLNGFYEDALVHYRHEKAKGTLQYERTYLDEINKHISECTTGISLLNSKDTTIQLYTIGDSINSPYQESSIYFASDSLMYITSAKPSKTGGISENIYSSKMIGDKWSKISAIGKPINTNGNDAILGLANKGEKLFLYADVNGGDIYYTNKKGATWTKPVVFSDSINSIKMESSLCFSADSATIYFISNRDGAIGGKDIFYSIKEEKGWSRPLNMGGIINSEFDEESPFLLGDTLYFSSRGHTSCGGYDVFKTYKQNGKWVTPVNLGFPINSPYDELSYTIFNKLAYIVTDRPGGLGEADIYEIDLIENRIEQPILDDETIAKNDSIEVAIVAFNDSLAVEKKDSVAFAKTTSLKAAKAIEEKCNTLSSLNKNKSVDLVDFLNLEPVMFEFGKYSLSADSRKSLDAIIQHIQKCPDLNLEIRTYADCRGSADYNKLLSDKRALAIKEYIQKSDPLLSKRTKAIGFGENRPLFDCDCDGESIQKKCPLSKHIQNRRVEIKLASDKFTSGNVLIEKGYYVVLESEGTEEDAKRKIKLMHTKNPTLNLMITQNLRKSWFHICVDKTYSKETVSKEASHYKGIGFSDAWYIYVD